MPTRVLKRRGTAEASTGAAGAPEAASPSAKSARASLPSSSPPDVDCDRLPAGLGLGRPEPSGVDTMSDVSVVAAVGGLLSLGGGSAPVTDAQDVEATAVHVDIITREDDDEQGGEAGEEASGTSVAKTRKRKRIETCKLLGCDEHAPYGKEGYCCAHHTDLVMGDERHTKPAPKAQKTCKLPCCKKRARREKGMDGYCQAHFTEFVGVPKPDLRTRHNKVRMTCKLPGCEKGTQSGKEGYCWAHHSELVLGVQKRPRKSVPRGRICSVPGCPKQVQQGGLCCRHGAKSSRGMCRHDGCTNASKRGGLCRRHGAFDLNSCDRKGCRSVAVHGIFCSVHTETCAKEGCRAAATSGYYCQRHYAKPASRKTVVTGGRSKGEGIKRARTIKKTVESDDNEDYDPSEEEYCRPVKTQKQASPRKHRYGTRGIRLPPPPPSPPSSEDEDEEEEEMTSFPPPEGSKCNIHTKSVEGSSSGARMTSSATPGGSVPMKRSKKTAEDGAEKSLKRATGRRSAASIASKRDRLRNKDGGAAKPREVPKRKNCKLPGCKKESRPGKGMEGYCQAHHTEFVLGVKKSAPFQLDPVDESRIDVAIAAVQSRYGTGAEGDKKLSNLTVRGITKRRSGKWQAQVYYAGGSHYLGVFPSRTQAVLAYEVARELLEKEYSVEVDKSAKKAEKRAAAERSMAVAREAARKASALAESHEG